MSDLGGLIAPRKLIMVNGEKDKIFPIGPAKKTFNHIKELYSAINKEDSVFMVIGSEGHRFYAEQTWRIINEQIKRIKDND